MANDNRPPNYMQGVFGGNGGPNNNFNNFSDDELFMLALRIIDGAYRDVLIDLNGNVIFDLAADFEEIQHNLNSVEAKRISAVLLGHRQAVAWINISVQDLRAVLFKPIANIPFENEDAIMGRGIFSSWVKSPAISLEQELNINMKISRPKLIEYYFAAYTRILTFTYEVLSYAGDLATFIDRLLDELPTAFGNPSPS